jgi:outer membrane cobalamin receptor
MKNFFILLLLFVAYSSNAQDNNDSLEINEVDFFSLSFDELSQINVSTASKIDEEYQEVPGVVTIITADEINKFGATSLIDVLERATSLIMTGSYIYPQNISSMRGEQSSDFDNHVLLLIDGNPYNSSITGGINFPLYLSFPLSVIDRIEIVRGPGSVLYGTNAYEGIINIITKTNSEEGITGITSFTHGSFESFGAENTILYKKGDFNLTTSFKYFDEKGWAFNAENADSMQNNSLFGEQNTGLFIAAKYKKINVTGFMANSFQDNIDNWDTVGSGGVKVKHFFLDFGYNDDITDYWKTNIDLTLNFDNNNIDFIGGYQIGKSNDISIDFNNLFTICDKIDLLAGGILQLDKGNMQSFLQRDSSLYILNDIPKYRELNYIGYANISYKPIKEIKLTAGVQVNKTYTQDIDFVPRFGAIFNLENGVGFKINYGKAYRSPSLIERSFSTAGFIENPNLLPEKISTIDLQAFYNKKNYQFALTYFNSEQKNIIGLTTIDQYYNLKFYENKKILYTGGIELEGKAFINKSLFLTSNMTYQLSVSDSKKDNTYKKLFMFKFGVAYDVFAGVNIAVFNTFYSNEFNDTDIPYTRQYNLATLKTSINLSDLLKFEKKSDIIFSFYIYNIFDEEIMIPDLIGSKFTAIPAKHGRSAYGSVIFVF